MIRRALIIGSQTGELRGVHRDVERVANKLRHGFGFDDITTIIEKEATRAGILAQYDRLIERTESGDSVVVYYSGHGAFAQWRKSDGGMQQFQCIVPTDMEESKSGDFRGIMNYELSYRLRQLTAKTSIVSVILDCCHAARMSRSIRVTSKAWHELYDIDATAKLAIDTALPANFGENPGESWSNPHAVRLVAAGMTESAYEYMNERGEHVGLMTESLLRALEDSVDLRVSWNVIAERVRERVQQTMPSQHVGLEGASGPRRRAIFSADEIEEVPSVPAILDKDGRVRLGAGRIMGVNVGDEYSIMPAGANEKDDHNAIAKVTVVEVQPGVSYARCEFLAGHSAIPDGARAFCDTRAAKPLRVLLDAKGTHREDLEKALQSIPAIEVVTDPKGEAILAAVHLDDQDIAVFDQEETLVFAAPVSNEALRDAVDQVKRTRIAHGLRTLEGCGISGVKPEEVDVEWGRVVEGKPVLLDHAGQTIHIGDRVYITVRNRSPRTLFVSVFDIGVCHEVTLVSSGDAHGMQLVPGASRTLGGGPGNTLRGLETTWPDAVERDGARNEEIVLVITDSPVNLQALETPGQARAARGNLHTLQEIAKGLDGGTRGIKRAEATEDQFLVKKICFMLAPAPRAHMPTIHRRGPITRSATPRALQAAQNTRSVFVVEGAPNPVLLDAFSTTRSRKRNLAIRIKEMTVHKNGTLFPFATDLRLDTMIVTGGTNKNVAPYRPMTHSMPNVKKGQRLAFDDLLVYDGVAEDFVVLAIWLSRADADAPTFGDVLVKHAQQSSDVWGPLVEGAAGLPSGTLSAAMAFIEATYRVLSKALAGTTVGLYRTSLLATDDFKIGRHPKFGGQIQAQDMSFVYEVVETR